MGEGIDLEAIRERGDQASRWIDGEVLDDHYSLIAEVTRLRSERDDSSMAITNLTRRLVAAEERADRLEQGIREMWDTWMDDSRTWVEVAEKLDNLHNSLDSGSDSDARCSCGVSAGTEHYCKTLNRLRRASTGEVPE